jgi:predicted DNA-binding transcriptional regulator AlpA
MTDQSERRSADGDQRLPTAKSEQPTIASLSRMERVLRTREAAEYLSISPHTLAKMRVKGGGPRYRKLGPKIVGYFTDRPRHVGGDVCAPWVGTCARRSTSDDGSRR